MKAKLNLNAFKAVDQSKMADITGGTVIPVPYPCPGGSAGTGTTTGTGGTVGSGGSTSTSNGDEPGTLKGCMSSKILGPVIKL